MGWCETFFRSQDDLLTKAPCTAGMVERSVLYTAVYTGNTWQSVNITAAAVETRKQHKYGIKITKLQDIYKISGSANVWWIVTILTNRHVICVFVFQMILRVIMLAPTRQPAVWLIHDIRQQCAQQWLKLTTARVSNENGAKSRQEVGPLNGTWWLVDCLLCRVDLGTPTNVYRWYMKYPHDRNNIYDTGLSFRTNAHNSMWNIS